MSFLFNNQRKRSIQQLDAASEVVETARGPVEFARHGDAPYVVIFHGTPQGHNASFLGEPLVAAGFGTITPSRPGYLRTPLKTGRTFPEQADAIAALLDELSIDQVAAYALSGGGPSGIQFAARHPDRVKALILEVAIAQTYSPQVSEFTVRLFMNPLMFWLQGQMLQYLPRLAVSQFVGMESSLERDDRDRITDTILANSEQIALLRSLIAGSPPFDLLRPGFENDMKQFRAIQQLPLDQITCPTLVAHGTHDADVPFAHAEAAARDIPNAQLHAVEKGWHLLDLSAGAEATAQARLNFLKEHLTA